MCGSERFLAAFEEEPYSVRRCEACGFGWVSPRLTEDGLASMYGDDSYWRSESPKSLGYGDYRSQQTLYLKTFKQRLRFALRGGGPRGGKALDVGCAAGFCMLAMSELGFEAHGVEISAEIARHAQEELGFETVHVGTLATSPHAPSSFDLITMWDVVEHVVDPRALLLRALELLKPDGLLVLETQNIDSAFARLLGPRWHHYKHREHIYHFTPATITSLLESAGFVVEKLTPRYGGKHVSFEFIAERAGRLHPVLSRALRPLARFESAALYLNFMDEMVVVARPRVESGAGAGLAAGTGPGAGAGLGAGTGPGALAG
jgi:2-polyprenyl-3-methyl-5-hydroxy-6-metoxy-1,4-benzoquinol methylase